MIHLVKVLLSWLLLTGEKIQSFLKMLLVGFSL